MLVALGLTFSGMIWLFPVWVTPAGVVALAYTV